MKISDEACNALRIAILVQAKKDKVLWWFKKTEAFRLMYPELIEIIDQIEDDSKTYNTLGGKDDDT